MAAALTDLSVVPLQPPIRAVCSLHTSVRLIAGMIDQTTALQLQPTQLPCASADQGISTASQGSPKCIMRDTEVCESITIIHKVLP